MAEALDRDTMIHLLNRLGSENDTDVLEAARYLHERLAESGMSWDDLLIEEFDEGGAPATEPAEPAPAAKPAAPANAEDDPLAVIETLLARTDISESLRDELEGYKSDIAEGEFADADRRYLAALHARLT